MNLRARENQEMPPSDAEREFQLKRGREIVSTVKNNLRPLLALLEAVAKPNNLASELARQIIKEATTARDAAFRFSSDWPEFQTLAAELNEIIDEARDFIPD